MGRGVRAMVAALALFPAAARASVGCYGSDHEDCRWGATDYAVEGTALGLMAVDWMQSRYPGFEESNPLLGRRPSMAKVNLMIGGAMVGHALVAGLLPRPWRWLWAAPVITIESVAVRNNVVVMGGFKVSLP